MKFIIRGQKVEVTDSIKNYIKEKMPGVMLTADLMVGFPGESEEDFLDTMRFVGEARLLDAHVFAYSRREGTPAADYPDQIDEQIKKDRSARLIAECKRVRDEVLNSVIDSAKPLSVIMETAKGSSYHGHSDSYIEVCAESEKNICGELVLVKPVSHKDGVIYGKII